MAGLPVIAEAEVDEVKNMGSTGDDASVAVDKGKDLFSTGEDQHELAFGTKKQTASDPADVRSLHRMISRPFSESIIRKISHRPSRIREISGERMEELAKLFKKIDEEVAEIVDDVEKL